MRRTEIALTLVWIAIALVVAGFALSLLGVEEAIAAAVLGFALFVVAAWIAARPSPPRPTSPTAVYPPHPWGPDPNLIEFGDRLRREAEQAGERDDTAGR